MEQRVRALLGGGRPGGWGWGGREVGGQGISVEGPGEGPVPVVGFCRTPLEGAVRGALAVAAGSLEGLQLRCCSLRSRGLTGSGRPLGTTFPGKGRNAHMDPSGLEETGVKKRVVRLQKQELSQGLGVSKGCGADAVILWAQVLRRALSGCAARKLKANHPRNGKASLEPGEHCRDIESCLWICRAVMRMGS